MTVEHRIRVGHDRRLGRAERDRDLVVLLGVDVRDDATTYTAVANDFVSCSGTFTVTLPAAAANANAAIWVCNNGTGTITVGRTGSDTVGLATSQSLFPAATASNQGDEMTFISDGISNWAIT